MRSHKVEPYRSVMDALAGPGCPLCRYLKNFQLKCVQVTLSPRPSWICNFHAWAIAATHDKRDASLVFLKLVSSKSLGGEGVCDICAHIEKEDVAQLRLVATSFKTLSTERWLSAFGEMCIPHNLALRKNVPGEYIPTIDKALSSYRDRLVQTIQEQRVDEGGGGILGRAAEFLTGQRGLYR